MSEKLSEKDVQLSYVMGTLVPAGQAHKQKTGETIGWADVPAPPKGTVAIGLDDNGAPKAYLDSKGRPIVEARRVLQACKNLYRLTRPALFAQLRAIEKRINRASGITQGRGGAEKLTDDEADSVFDALKNADL